MINYTITKPEAYGYVGAYGNKYWLHVQEGSKETDVEKLLGYLLKTCKREKVMFPSPSEKIERIVVKAMEITFFVYTDPEKETGVDAADLIYEWEEKEGLVQVKGGG